MLQRAIRLLLLFSVGFWAIGAATYLHERLEHGPDSATARLHAWLEQKRLAHGSAPQDSRQRDHDDHDDCPTCQLLVHMSAAGITAPASIPVEMPVAPASPVFGWRAPLVSLHAPAPIRGPPFLFEICA